LPVGIVKDSDGWGIARRRPGRPRIEPQLRRLIQRMAMENGLWGAPRIHGELLKLGFSVSDIFREPRRQPGAHLDDDVVVPDEP